VAEQQFSIITARVQDSTVVLSTRDPNLTQSSDGKTWTFKILKDTPPEVVFLLDIVDGGNGWTVRSFLRLAGSDTLEDPVHWTRERLYVSPAFVHSNGFQLEIQRSRSSTSTVRGGGFFQIQNEGGDL
jgi:hypothetical protein